MCAPWTPVDDDMRAEYDFRGGRVNRYAFSGCDIRDVPSKYRMDNEVFDVERCAAAVIAGGILQTYGWLKVHQCPNTRPFAQSYCADHQRVERTPFGV